ncbi:MAG TPA: hypothetical protein VM186_03080, partial [Planctomycetota bacterium]|nr:hypothetical protein [Planctomycetota bacterium]
MSIGSTIRRRFATVLATAALVVIAAGCGPSVDAVVKMRETLPPATGTRGTVGANLVFAQDKQRLKAETRARENLAGLMERFERPHSDECWRAEAMTSMLAIEQWLQCPQKDRATHSRFKALLKAEYQAPRLKNGDGSDGGVCDAFYQLRAWGVYTLGKLDDPDLDEFFVSVLASDID